MKDDKLTETSPAMSWLVRCWEEPREVAQGEPVPRCFIRDLRTGEERYLSDPREIGELMLRQLRAARRDTRVEPAERERQGNG
ncbi:MAG TPA: hypothetical protein VKK31_04685 [Thermoanaerobaculia bacterium]|nr:hypothetical protein [Thermoanaerobaculia bacterium]